MLLSASIERTAREICEHEWQRLRRRPGDSGVALDAGDQRHEMDAPHRPGAGTEAGPRRARGGQARHCPDWLLPDLLALIAENHHRPVNEMAPMIRRLIEEHDFFEEAGDPMIDARHDELVDDYVQLFVHALEQVRCRAMQQSDWSHLPVTPQMFG